MNDFDVLSCNARVVEVGETEDGRIDVVVDQTCLNPKGGGQDWVAGKGAHYPHMSFVEYEGLFDPEKSGELSTAITECANEIVAWGGENTLRFMPVEEMDTVCRHVPDNIPTNKPARVVIYGENFGVPCGGTHVKRLEQIGEVQITKIKRRSGTVRASYSIGL